MCCVPHVKITSTHMSMFSRDNYAENRDLRAPFAFQDNHLFKTDSIEKNNTFNFQKGLTII